MSKLEIISATEFHKMLITKASVWSMSGKKVTASITKRFPDETFENIEIHNWLNFGLYIGANINDKEVLNYWIDENENIVEFMIIFV